MARIRNKKGYSDTNARYCQYKERRQGAIEDALWAEEELVDYRSGRKKTRRSRGCGCPGNDYNAHVYVWVIETVRLWSDRVYEVNRKKCCGCGKVATTRYKW